MCLLLIRSFIHSYSTNGFLKRMTNKQKYEYTHNNRKIQCVLVIPLRPLFSSSTKWFFNNNTSIFIDG